MAHAQASEFRLRAEKLRTIARGMQNVRVALLLRSLADRYDQIAERLERAGEESRAK